MTDTLPAPFDVKLMNIAASAVFMLFGGLVLAAGVWWALRNPVFALAGISVTGDVTHNNAVTLRANVAPRLRGNFFTVDLAQTRAVFEAVPWVRRAVVHRVFPNRLMVVLQEHQAVAYWGEEGESRLVNSFGEVFDANTGDVEQDDLPRLAGPEGQAPAVLAMYQAVKPLLATLDLGLEELTLSGRGGWQAVLDTGATMELGRGTPQDVVPRVERFVRTLTQVTSKYGRRADAVESADLRHGDGYALRLRGVTTLVKDEQGKQEQK
ncbi:MAG: cell division protein FtsQ/DivIB [Ramlibacter sp.]|nr:cell division protein FtsQ/DivIB [Ramlibacter sp.]MCW5649807.1 cell division protein FtsQ/DivIB [Ramlibacter sp.]